MLNADDEPRLAGRRVLVTGASRGIGAAFAERAAAEGASVALVARTRTKHDHLAGSLTETAQRLAPYGNPVVIIEADLADPTDRPRVVTEAVAGLGGPVEVLVNNAAAAIYAPIEGYPLRRRQITFEVNVHAPVDLIQLVLPDMVEREEGWIVNLSSSSARLLDGPPFAAPPLWSTMAVYAASKAALNRLTNGLGEALSGTGVRVNAVQPRKGVASDGARQLVGGRVDESDWETMDEMIEAVLALCDCGPDWTGRVWSSDEVRAARAGSAG